MGLLVLFVVAVLVLVDPNDYRDEIAQAVEGQTGRQLAIEGDLSLTFFPRFGIELGRTRLADAPGFGAEPFVEVERVQLAVQVMPLLGGELRLDTVVLDQPRVRLIRNAEGLGNWETLAGARTPPPSPIRPVAQHTGPEAPAVPPLLQEARLAGLRVQQADISLEDRQAGTRVQVQPLNLTLRDVQLGEPIDVAADWRAALDQGLAVSGELETRLTLDRELRRLAAEAVALDLVAEGEAIPAGRQPRSRRAW